ncbi:MAG: carboxylating nicotinate-nucleotide diphosphorylase [Myxococcales bacterium]|nr:carboxylating nicotinate-nucleotide diphosphorylase [Myxococcales bacterium]
MSPWHVPLSPLVHRLVALALEEDLALGDPTTEATVSPSQRGVGTIRAKAALVLAGTAVARAVCAAVDPTIELTLAHQDGDRLVPGTVIGQVTGLVRSLLKAERTILNFLQRLSGVATLTARYVAETSGTEARIVDTRKTTPGWRVLEKAAVIAGGGHNHRFSLGSGVLIKDNHVDAAGGVRSAVLAAKASVPHLLGIEVEVRDLAELDEAIGAGAQIVLLDNMPLAQLTVAVRRAKAAGVLTEASGGVNLDTVRGIAETGVDLISVGALTHSATAVDINLKVVPT